MFNIHNATGFKLPTMIFSYCLNTFKYQLILVGLKTALVEADDFASGTSSRSTKLIHGGVRYLQKAILNLDIEQYRMVKEALHERTNMLTAAPHLTHPLPIMLPVYKWVVRFVQIYISSYCMFRLFVSAVK